LLSVVRPAADTLSNLEFVTKSNHLPVVRLLRFGCAGTLPHGVLVATACLLRDKAVKDRIEQILACRRFADRGHACLLVPGFSRLMI
jgi:hypothetical protein